MKSHRVVRDITERSTIVARSDAAIEAAENEGWPPRSQSALLPRPAHPRLAGSLARAIFETRETCS